MDAQTIVVVGGLARRHITEADEVPGLGETIETTKPFKSHTGGRGAFTAVTVHRLSHVKPPEGKRVGAWSAFANLKINVNLVATVGADETGKSLKGRMTECGVNADNVHEIADQESSRVVVIVDKKTKRHRIWFDAAANHLLESPAFRDTENFNRLSGGHKPVLLITNMELKQATTEQLIQTAHNSGVPVLLNLVPSNTVLDKVQKAVTHLVLHEAEARRSFENCPSDGDDPKEWKRIAEQFLAKNVVIVLGAQGAYFLNDFTEDFVPTDQQKGDVINQVGGAELFVGAYAVDYVRQLSNGKVNVNGSWDIEHAVKRACKAANYNLDHEGCIYPLPWANEIPE